MNTYVLGNTVIWINIDIFIFYFLECPFDEHNLPKDAKKTNRKAFNRTKNFIEKMFDENSQTKVSFKKTLIIKFFSFSNNTETKGWNLDAFNFISRRRGSQIFPRICKSLQTKKYSDFKLIWEIFYLIRIKFYLNKKVFPIVALKKILKHLK